MENWGTMITGLGAALIVVGLGLWFAAKKLSWFGHLPGDIRVNRPRIRFYAPVATMLLFSAVLSVAFWLFRKFFR